MTDRLFTASNSGKFLQAVEFGRPPVLCTAGDSIADFAGGIKINNTAIACNLDGISPLFWALSEFYFGDCTLDGRSFATGGYNLGVGGTSSSDLLTTQLPQLLSLNPKPDIVYVQTAQNDAIATLANAVALSANLTSFATQALAAGVRLVILCPVPPKTGVGSNVKSKDAFNRILEKFASATPGAVFIDYTSLWADPAGINGAGILAWRGTDGTTSGYSSDGTHPSQLGCRMVAQKLATIFQRVMRPIYPRTCLATLFDATNNPDGNLIGQNGMFIGTSGNYNTVANPLVAGVAEAGSALGWNVSDVNGVIATPSIVTDSDGFRGQRLTFSGTASANATIALTYSFSRDVPSAQYSAECSLALNNIVGLNGFDFLSGCGHVLGDAVSATAKPLPDNYTGKMLLKTRRAITFSNSGSATKTQSVRFRFLSGVSPTGSVDISRIGIFREN